MKAKKIFCALLSATIAFTSMPSSVFAVSTSQTEETVTDSSDELELEGDKDNENEIGKSEAIKIFSSTISSSSVKVSDAAALEAALEAKSESIEITDDFEIDRTFYVSSETTIYTTEKHTLTRATDFGGDIFVVGEDKNGRNKLLDNVNISLNFGNPESAEENLLIIDGNKDNMIAEVNGTAIFLCNSANVNMFSNVSIINCKKTSNKKTLDEAYTLPYQNRVGGAAAIISSGSFNMYGGIFADNIVNDENNDTDDEDMENGRESSLGGAIFNFGNFRMYGGCFEGNHAARGGAIYNYRIIKLYDAEFNQNTSSKYAGAIYQAESQYGEIIMGGNSTACSSCDIKFDGNSAKSSGGAIFSQTKNCIMIYEDANAIFKNNKSELYNGGAINSSGTLTIKKAEFEDNDANSKGGAIYITNSDDTLVVRYPDIQNVTFKGNTAARGGAVGMMAKDTSYSVGGIAKFTDCTFTENRSILKSSDSSDDTDKDTNTNGGAIYLSRKSELTANGCVFSSNEALDEGGAIYGTGNSKIALTKCKMSSNQSTNAEEGNGGAIAIHGTKLTAKDCKFTGNLSGRHAGALYVSYNNLDAGDTRASTAVITDSAFTSNACDYHGGAVYVTSEENSSSLSYLNVSGSTFKGNKAQSNGGAVYFTKSKGDLNDNEFISNEAVADDKSSADESSTKTGGGGALYATNSDIDVNSARMTKNISQYNGAAMAFYSGSTVKLNRITASGNSTQTQGGVAYINKSEMNMYNSNLNGNSTQRGGGAISTYTDAESNIYATTIENNTAANNGGGLYFGEGGKGYLNDVTLTENSATKNGGAVYVTGVGTSLEADEITFDRNSAVSGGAVAIATNAEVIMNQVTASNNTGSDSGGVFYSYGKSLSVYNSTFSNNATSGNGGVVVTSKAAVNNLYNNTATGNSADKGGILYITTTGTVANINGLSVSGNTGTGPVVYGYTAKAILNISKTNYTDSDSTVDDSYWTALTKNANKLTINYIDGDIPEYSVSTLSGAEYSHEEYTPDETNVDSESVDKIFELAENSSEESISDVYDKLPKLDNSSNFMSLGTTLYNDINDGTVSVDSFVYRASVASNNPNVGEGLLIYQAMCYKKAHPDQQVSIDISSFRFSTESAVCINRNSRYFGYMRNLVGEEYDEYGFVRIVYLLVCAAKMGINVTALGQLDGYPQDSSDLDLEHYFTDKMNDVCDSGYAAGKKIKDYLTFHHIDWTSYGNDAATDMMHTKACAVSNYIDKDGKEHRNALWLSSTNLDGIYNATGFNGNNALQTAVIISDHEQLYKTARNYIRLMSKYSGQEDVYEFRELVNQTMTNQIDKLKNGKGDEISEDEQIVYLGTDKDDVFELYFSPFGGDAAKWDETYNPLCKYLRKLRNSDDYIWLSWNNVKFNKNFSLANSFEDIVNEAFSNNKNSKNRLYVTLPNFDASSLSTLKLGLDIQYKMTGKRLLGGIHSKDMQLSYSENGTRKYVTLLNSMNLHQGAMSYQSNFALVIKENSCTSDSVFYKIADNTSNGIVRNDLKYATVELSSTSYIYNGKKPTVTVSGANAGEYTVEYSSNPTSVGTHTVTVKGTGEYCTGTKVLKYTVKKVTASKISLKKKTATYTGKVIKIGAATKEGSTGKVTYTYYTDSSCITKTTSKNSGASKTGTAPKNIGVYYVRATVAEDANYKGATSAAVKLIIRPKKTDIKSVKSTASKTITVKWSKKKNITGYQIRCVIGSKKKTVIIKNKKKTIKKITGLTKKKTYKVSIRTYKTVGKTKVWSEWSNVKKVKIKK